MMRDCSVQEEEKEICEAALMLNLSLIEYAVNGCGIQNGFALGPSDAYERITLVGVHGGSVAGDHVLGDSD